MYDIASIYSARSVDDAIRALQADPAAVVIAGGTDVLIKIREGKLAGCSLVSIHELGEELSGVTLADNGDVEIGPLTTFRGVTFSDVIRRTIPVLGEAADMAGGPQLRAAGTIGGNVCNGITSADTASTLVALDAVLRVRGPKGEREVPISQWYQGVGKVALAPYELLVKIVIPYDNYVGYTGHYIKYAQRNAMDIATLGVSCLVKLTSDKKMVDDAALAFGVAGPVPMRSPAAEAAVRGLPIGEAVAAIGEAALADVNPRTSWRVQGVPHPAGQGAVRPLPAGGGPEGRGRRMIEVLRCTVNNKPVEVGIDPRESLADVLRERLGLTSVKKGCEVGECGACTVLVDGTAIDSCIYLGVWAQGKSILTVEGLQDADGGLSPIQRAFVEEAAVQCGFCTPGIIMSAVEIVGSGKQYTREELRKLISGHLCRCTGYQNILNAVERAVNEAHRFVGKGE